MINRIAIGMGLFMIVLGVLIFSQYMTIEIKMVDRNGCMTLINIFIGIFLVSYCSNRNQGLEQMKITNNELILILAILALNAYAIKKTSEL